jgi:phage virion morphogenesis protein
MANGLLSQPMVEIKVKIDDSELQSLLKQIIRRVEDMTPVMEDVGEYLAESTKGRFVTSTAPDGSTWPANRPVTLLRKPQGLKPLIGETKTLSTQINYRAGQRFVMLYSTVEYAAVQQFGAEKGQFGKTPRGMLIPWGKIPPRPFLGVSDKDVGEIKQIIRGYIEGD